MKSVFFNPIANIDGDNHLSVYEKIYRSGLNTGNRVFTDAINQQIQFKMEGWFQSEEILELDENNIGVLACANMLNIKDQFLDAIWERIAELRFPVTLVGLGAQSTEELDTPKKLMSAMPKERIQALSGICNQTETIGIRGEFTAECLEIVGIKNYRVIGCPSLYKYENQYELLRSPNVTKCLYHMAGNVEGEHKLLRFGMENNLIWIMQSMVEMPRTVFENCHLTKEAVLKRFPGYEDSIEALENYMRQKARMFFSMKEWYTFLKQENFTFSFGGRFHGNVAALRCGIPALWITHDSRTKELTNLFHLPSIDVSQLQSINSLEDFMPYCSYDDFYKTYPGMFREYKSFLEENSIDHKWNKES